MRTKSWSALCTSYMEYRYQILPLPECEPLFSVPQVQIQVAFYIINMSCPFPESPDYSHMILFLLSAPLVTFVPPRQPRPSSREAAQPFLNSNLSHRLGPLLRPQLHYATTPCPTTPCYGRLHNLDSDPMLHATEVKFSSPVTSCCTTSAGTYVVFPNTTYAHAPTFGHAAWASFR
jgi:hypothetical protein